MVRRIRVRPLRCGHKGHSLDPRGVVQPRVVCQESHVVCDLVSEVQARRELDGVARPQWMASEEREGGLGDLGGELDQSDRADVSAKSGQSPIEITGGQGALPATAGQRGCDLDL